LHCFLDSSDKDNPGIEIDDDGIFTLLEEGDAFIEVAFNTRLDDTERNKKKVKLGLPNS